jgi:hypothetical protein
MNKELDIYKKNKIKNLQNIYNKNVSSLKYLFVLNINKINSTRLISQSVKQRNINNLNTQYNANINALKTKLSQDIINVQKFTPNKIEFNKNNKALLIGINYIGTQNELYGCINDVNNIKERISKKGFTDNNIKIMTDLTPKIPNKLNILEEFKNLLVNSEPGDLLFFLYSGHGSYTIDRNGDEKDRYDEMIIPSDLQGILDDDIKTLIQTYLKSDVTLFAMFDSCFSGSVLDLKYQYLDSLNYDTYTENPNDLETKGNVFMISGSTDEQTSADAIINNKASGAMTWSLLEALNQNPTCSWRDLIKTMRDLLSKSKYTQIPQFSSGTFVNIDLEVFI